MAARSHVGAVRQSNEDACYADPANRLFVVADGMGGHAAGEVASAMAVDIVRAAVEAARDDLDAFARAPGEPGRARIRALLDGAIRAANAEVLARSEQERDKHGMGTTLDAVLILAGEAFVAHAGDSRTYLFRGDSVYRITLDHTVAQAMCTAGAMTEEEAASSTLGSVLSNAVGVSADIEIDHVHFELAPGDRLLLCSDGLYDYFDPDELARCVTRYRGDRALAELVDRACLRGGSDNITGIVIEIGRPPVLRGRPLDDVDDAALTAFVERALFESSKPHRLPAI